MDDQRLHYLGQMGIDVYLSRGDENPADALSAVDGSTSNAGDVRGEAAAVPAAVAAKPNEPIRPAGQAPEPPASRSPDTTDPVANASAKAAPVSSPDDDGPPAYLFEAPPPSDSEYAAAISAEEMRLDEALEEPAAVDPTTSMSWEQLAEAVSGCSECALSTSRSKTVFGVGDQNARLMVIGEAPGQDEDRQGEPFVGRAGKLLDNMLKAIGHSRETNVFIANVLKCRPPGNRNPQAEEIEQCHRYLDRQIALLKPSLILAVGRIPAHYLLDTTEAIGRLRGKLHRHAASGVPVIVTYHPSYLLRSPAEKAKSWQDLCQAQAVLNKAD